MFDFLVEFAGLRLSPLSEYSFAFLPFLQHIDFQKQRKDFLALLIAERDFPHNCASCVVCTYL